METEEQGAEGFENWEREFGWCDLWLALYLWTFMIWMPASIDPSVVHKGLLLSSSHNSTSVVIKCRVGRLTIFTEQIKEKLAHPWLSSKPLSIVLCWLHIKATMEWCLGKVVMLFLIYQIIILPPTFFFF